MCKALEPFADFYFLVNYTRRWDEKNRAFPLNASYVTHFEKGKYDFAILHTDQQCSNDGLNKTRLIKNMKATIKEIEPELPIVFINHGTPVYPEYYPDGTSENGYVSEKLRQEILDIVGDDFMIVNSKQAALDWKRGTTIYHGIDAEEWPEGEKEPRAMTFVSQAGIGDRYYNRTFLANVIQYLREKHGISHQWVNTPGCYTANGIEDYKRFLGKSLVYFNPTYASPMPRSRTEAMLAGCCIVTTPSHDADTFITEGVNGFLVDHDNYEYAGEVIARLIFNYRIAVEVGKMGRETALQLFNRKRYRGDWMAFIHNELGISL